MRSGNIWKISQEFGNFIENCRSYGFRALTVCQIQLNLIHIYTKRNLHKNRKTTELLSDDATQHTLQRCTSSYPITDGPATYPELHQQDRDVRVVSPLSIFIPEAWDVIVRKPYKRKHADQD